MSTLFVIAGSSGAGKTFLLDNVSRISEKLIIVNKKTTRDIRVQEKNLNLAKYDLQFDFSSEEVCKSDFHYSFRNKWYGLNRADIDTVFLKGKSPIFVLRRVSAIIALQQAYSGRVKSILCQSCFTKEELIDYLLKKGNPISEVKDRILSKHEEECNNEYRLNKNLFDCTIINHYDSKFIEEAKNFILANMS